MPTVLMGGSRVAAKLNGAIRTRLDDLMRRDGGTGARPALLAPQFRPAGNNGRPRFEPGHLPRIGRIASRLLAAVLSLACTAYGHAIVVSATPAQHQEVGGPDVPVNLRFNSRIDLKRSRLMLVMPDGEQVALSVREAPAGDCLVSEAKGLKSGSYLLRWQVLAADGHITRGEVPFRVK